MPTPARTTPALLRTLTPLAYFAFGFGSMVGVGWLVVMDDWLARGGPGRGDARVRGRGPAAAADRRELRTPGA